MRLKHLIIPLVTTSLALAGCGGDDDSAEPADTAANDAPAADEAEDDGTAEVDASDEPADQPADEPADDGDGDTQEEPADETTDEDDGGGTTDLSDIDWATVDLTTIDWANIDISEIDLVAVQDNPTVDDLSEADIALIQERNAAQFGSGDVTLTIADRTWNFTGFQCAFESSGLLNDGTTLGTNLFGEVDGARIQMQIDAYDDGTAQFTMDDIDDFENPSVNYLETTDIEVTIDGNTVRAQGDVTDEASESFDIVPMVFEGECGPGSAR